MRSTGALTSVDFSGVKSWDRVDLKAFRFWESQSCLKGAYDNFDFLLFDFLTFDFSESSFTHSLIQSHNQERQSHFNQWQ